MLHYRLHKDPRSSHQQIARLLNQLRPEPILDVGAAQGFLGRLLQGANLTIDAVEPNPQWAEHARPFYRNVFPSTVENADLPPKTYNAIVCADVLEHLIDPLATLRRLRTTAADNAVFIISLPNIAHLAIRMMLLTGQFPQMDRGPLDRTHLHFYTRDTAQDLLRDAGLRVEQVLTTPVPLDELWRRGESHPLFKATTRMQHALIDIAPRLFAFQWVFVARQP
ncbi:MAG: class I SAM-dependent methyltransferase [Planctomycetota bacterium]|nr:class I SAM-dependent methyltransferase [Planctomycetota bacterium]